MHNWKIEIYPEGQIDPETGDIIYINAKTVDNGEYTGEFSVAIPGCFTLYVKADTLQQAIAKGFAIIYKEGEHHAN